MTRSRLAVSLLLASVLAGTATGSINREVAAKPASASAPAPVGDTTRQEAADPLAFLESCIARYGALVDQGYAPRSLVALLPDPIDSRFRREFDLLLGAARRALESDQLEFLQDRHCLPWSVVPDSNRASGRHREAPGVILFRRDPGSTVEKTTSGEVLALYLVGEIPAWGVQTGALRLALQLSADGLASGASPARNGGPPEIRLLGPTFSGSTRSLAVALKAWHDERVRDNRPAPTFTIVSGTATSPSNPRVFRNTLGKAASYRSAVTDHDILQSCLWNRFVPGRLGLRTRTETPGEAAPDSSAVAILVENSLYGQEFVGRGFHVLPFPMHISQIRAEYEKRKKSATKGGGAASEQDLWAKLPNLDLDLADEHETLDKLPVFDANLTSRTQDLVLANILTTLARNRIEVAALVASNTVDKLFLAEILRSYAPDVRLITFEGDLLLAHPQYVPATLGMLVVSSNSLSDPDPLTSTGDGGVSLQFASDTAQGVFEATRALLASGSRAETPIPGPQEVWLSVVGRSALLPLERVRVDPAGDRQCLTVEEEVATASALPTSPPPPRGWALILSLTSVLIFVVLREIVQGARRNRRFLGVDWLQFTRWRRPRPGYPDPAARVVHGLIVLIPVATALPYALLSSPYLRLFSTPSTGGSIGAALIPSSWSEALFLLIVTCPVVLGLTTVTLLWGLADRTWLDLKAYGAEQRSVGRSVEGLSVRLRTAAASVQPRLMIVLPLLLAVAGTALAALAIAKGYGVFGVSHTSPWLLLLLNRSISLGSGASPLLPILLLLIVVIGWALASLWRHRTLVAALPSHEELRPVPRAVTLGSDDVEKRCDRLRRATARVRAAVYPATFWIRAHSLLWCVLLLIPALYLSLYYGGRRGPLLRGLEHRGFDWAMSVLLLVVIFLLLGSGLSLWNGWRALRRWLDQIRAVRLDPSSDGNQSLWLSKLQNTPGSRPSRSRDDLMRSRSEAYETLCLEVKRRRRGAVADDEATQDLRGRLRRLLRSWDRQGNDCQRHFSAWLAILEWIDERPPAKPAADSPEGEARNQPKLVDRTRDFFVAQTGFFTREALAQLGQLMAFVTAGLLLLFLAVSTYPFEPRRVLAFYTGSLLLLGVAQAAVILVQMERDDMVSRVTGGDPNRFQWHRSLLGRLGLFVGLPLVSVLASQVPELRRLVLQGLEPLLKALL
jgi:hypothetical protein